MISTLGLLEAGAPLSPTDSSRFSLLDWAVVGAYLVVVVLVGARMAKRKEQGDDFFLAGRSMPVWAVAVST